MALIDPRVTWRKVEERLETEPDPVLRRNLETLLAHMKAEMAGDVDGLRDPERTPRSAAYGSDDPGSSPVKTSTASPRSTTASSHPAPDSSSSTSTVSSSTSTASSPRG